MKRIIRIAGFALALLLLFLGALVVTADWLKRQNEELLAETLAAKNKEFAALLSLANPGPPPWNEEMHQALGRAIGGEVLVHAAPPPQQNEAAPDGARWRFTHQLRGAEGAAAAYAEVVLPVAPTARALVVFHRLAALVLLLAVLLLLVVVFLVILDRPWAQKDRELATEARSPATDYGVLSHLAARSALQSAELEKEREERQRAEADGHLKQILLNRALQERIDMGRDLHDGLIQSLYATGLTLQAGRKALDHDPEAARNQVDTALQTLNAAIREVRAYISGLGPEQLRQRSFADSVRAVVEYHSAVRELSADVRIDEQAAQQLAPAHITDLLQIVREAVSNSLRHGHARSIAIRLERQDEQLCLLLHDDGRGFDPTRAVRGHGLDNMQARAERLGAKFDCRSAPGQGTRLVFTFNAPATSPHP